jgi:hypothetical protein
LSADAANQEIDEAAIPRGKRGSGFPALSLPDAAEIIKRAGLHGRQHHLGAMASYAGHATANSGPFRRKLAALKDWGFVTTTPETVTITDAGMEVALPTTPEKTLNMLLDAFQGCNIFWKIYTEGAKDTPLYPGSIGNVAVTAHGVGAGAREAFVGSFIDSAVMVGLAEKLPNGEVKLIPTGKPRPVKAKTDAEIVHADGQRQTPNPDVQPGIRQVWRNNGVEIIFEVRAREPLTPTAFMQVGEVVTAIETLREVIAE